MEPVAKIPDPKAMVLLALAVFIVPLFLLLHVASAMAYVITRRASGDPRSPGPEREALLAAYYETVIERAPDEPGHVFDDHDDDLTVRSAAYGLDGGDLPSPGRRPAPRPARTWDYVVRILSAWPPTVEPYEEEEREEKEEEEEEEEASFGERSKQQPVGQ